MSLASSTLTSYSVHFIWTVFGIQLTGQCAAKGRRGSGSVINYRQISSYKDPSPPRAALFMARGKPHKSAAESPQLATLSAGIIILHGPGPSTFCKSHQCSKVGRCWSRDGCLITHTPKKKREIPTRSSRVVNLPLFLLSHSFTAIFIFCLFLLSCMHNTRLQWLRKEPLSLTHPSHAFYNAEATVPLPLAFPPHDIFLLVP